MTATTCDAELLLVIQQAEIESRRFINVTPPPPFYAVMTAQLERHVVRSRRGSASRGRTTWNSGRQAFI